MFMVCWRARSFKFQKKTTSLGMQLSCRLGDGKWTYSFQGQPFKIPSLRGQDVQHPHLPLLLLGYFLTLDMHQSPRTMSAASAEMTHQTQLRIPMFIILPHRLMLILYVITSLSTPDHIRHGAPNLITPGGRAVLVCVSVLYCTVLY